jgi:hypothetical protein
MLHGGEITGRIDHRINVSGVRDEERCGRIAWMTRYASLAGFDEENWILFFGFAD